MVNKKEIIKILLTLVLLVGVTAGATLVKERQDIREKAASECNPGEICKKSCSAGETPTGKSCSDILDGICCRPSCASIGGSCFDSGCPQGYTDLGRSSCPPDSKCCKLTSSPTPTPPGGGGGGGGGGNTAGCSSASAANCQGKNPGDQCKPGKKCKETNQKGGDGKPKCICESSGGGGGRGGTTGCDFSNGGKNPTQIGPFETDGEVVLFFAKFIDSASPKIALKKNASTCSLTDSDKVLDTQNISENGLLTTDLAVASGNYLCLYLEDVAESGGPYPTEGWAAPDGNLCGIGKEDISSLVSAAKSSGNNLFSTQCWGDYAAKVDCDFDDYALIVTIGKVTDNTTGLTLLFRQQGIITSISSLSPEYLKTTVTFRQNGDDILQIKNTPAENVDENGVWYFKVPIDSITPGTYDILIKGISHLQKKFTAVPISANQNQIDKSLDTKDELKAGDANNDNSITIEDISTVLTFYTDFKIPVDSQNLKMVYSDINKDGFITIDDVALTALNWSDFNIPGDK